MVNKKNTKNSEKAGSVVADPVQKKRGRPKGSKNTVQRPDRDIQTTEPGLNAKTTLFGITLHNLPPINVNEPEQVKIRINEYFSICNQFDLKPTIAMLAVSFGISRITLFNWLNGKNNTLQNRESINAIKSAYDVINGLYETYLNAGSMNPVSCFFLMKNNYGYKDVTDYVVTNNQETQLNLSDIANRAGLLSE